MSFLAVAMLSTATLSLCDGAKYAQVEYYLCEVTAMHEKCLGFELCLSPPVRNVALEI